MRQKTKNLIYSLIFCGAVFSACPIAMYFQSVNFKNKVVALEPTRTLAVLVKGEK